MRGRSRFEDGVGDRGLALEVAVSIAMAKVVKPRRAIVSAVRGKLEGGFCCRFVCFVCLLGGTEVGVIVLPLLGVRTGWFERTGLECKSSQGNNLQRIWSWRVQGNKEQSE